MSCNIKKCSRCGSTDLSTERRLNGYTTCNVCKMRKLTSEFYDEFLEGLVNKGKVLYTDKYDTNKYIVENDNFISAFGGDGTLLRAINLFKDKGKPFFGVARGTVSFLMNKEQKPIDVKTKTFNLIKVKVKYKNSCDMELSKTFQAFNDVCIGGDMSTWIEFDVNEKDEFFGTFKGGGLIISTPQGSTGINKNNNGSVLPLSSNLWSITGDKTDRKIEVVMKPRKTVIKVKSRFDVKVWVDGTNHIVDGVTEVIITKGDSVKVMFNNYSEFKRKRRS